MTEEFGTYCAIPISVIFSDGANIFIRPQPVSPERSVLCQGRITPSFRHSVSKNCVPFLGSHCPILTKIGKWLRLSSNKKDQVKKDQSFVESGSKIEKCE